MKRIFLSLVVLFSVTFINAQNKLKTFEEWFYPPKEISKDVFFTESELVFEGRFLKVVETYDSKSDGVYSIDAYKVDKVYKGDQSLSGDTIYTISKGGVLGEENFDYSMVEIRPYCPQILFDKGIKNYGVTSFTRSIFFFVSTDSPANPETTKYSSRKKFNTIYRYENLYVCGDIIAGLGDVFFKSREEFYDYMRQFEGFTVPEPVNVTPIEKQPEIQKYEYPVFDFDSIKQRRISDSIWNEFYKGKNIHKKKVRNNPDKNKPPNSLTLKIDNHHVVYDYATNKHHVKFDIMASSNNPELYLFGTGGLIQYNTGIFGVLS